ncbi:hypothetical protein EDC94DRAFT_665978 [Helicostylum pulchrum]|nr:hypothetical protein EDC94DRAFT_665978 [Helicostylum pulchrum]
MHSRKKFFKVAVITCIAAAILYGVFSHYKEDIVEFIQEIAIKMREHKYSSLIMVVIVALTGTPPLFGYTFAVTMTGFVYGFPNGCIPATTGAFLSSLATFGLVRKFNFAKYITFSEKKQNLYVAMQDAITQGGFKMMLLIRICPLPWQLTNLMLSLVPSVTWKTYISSALIACFKFNLDVWVGSQLANLSDPDLPPEAHKATLIYMCLGIIILVSSGFWLYKLTMVKVKEQQEKLLLSEGDERQSLLENQTPSLTGLYVK